MRWSEPKSVFLPLHVLLVNCDGLSDDVVLVVLSTLATRVSCMVFYQIEEPSKTQSGGTV